MIEKPDFNSDNKAIAEEIITEYKKYNSLRNKYTVIELLMEICILLVFALFLNRLLGYLKIESPEPILLIILGSYLLISIFLFPRLLITLIIFYRTRYSGLLVNIFAESSSFLFCILTWIFVIYFNRPNTLLGPLIVIVMIGVIIIASNIVLHILCKNKSIFNTNTITDYWSTILSQQSLIIKDKMDGYSQRPVYSNITTLKEKFSSDNDFNKEILAYIRFLATQGEVIGWKRKEHSIIYFPRVLLNYPKGIVHLFSPLRLLQKILFMEELTSVSINLTLEEISLFIKPDDYTIFNNVTFHLFCQEFLERTKNSIDAFINKDLTKSYLLLYPIDPEVKEIIENTQRKNFLAKKDQQQKNIDRPTFLALIGMIETLFGSAIAILFGFLLFIVGGASIGIVLNVIFLNTDYKYLNIFYASIPIFLLFIASCILFKAGIDLLDMKVWAYVTSVITFFILLVCSTLLTPILTSNLNGLLIDVLVMLFSSITIYYLYSIRKRFDFTHSFISRYIKTTNKVTKLNK